ncbi:hypothetical protein [Chitinophaga sp. Cy-1792]|uniref:hypothetical protein n=1 Tax=Chitinophaga sp. Cy-1792 TaxID=2608339 RepID=UPI00141FF6BF|nr:hypothetical protein [Chitinophaga sp. Cy-1792]NIG54391.1 hypothetical protein [Chitinophaga sp. Cy-1792]
MKSFILRILLFTAIFTGLLLLLGPPLAVPGEFDYVGGIVVKHARLNALKGHRVIFAGGSNVAFGLDSKMVEDAIHQPVVNLGLHGGLGLDFILQELEHTVRAGDVVFLSAEYFLESGRYDLDYAAGEFLPEAADYYQQDYYTTFKHLVEAKFDQVCYNRDKLLLRFKPVVIRERKAELEKVYSRHAFNSYGDVVAHLDLRPDGAPATPLKLQAGYWDGIAKINKANEIISAKGAKLYFLFPTFAQSSYAFNKAVIDQYQATIRADLKVPVVNKPEDFVYPDSLFFDSYYHLTKKTRILRTEKMISLIRPYVATAADPGAQLTYSSH